MSKAFTKETDDEEELELPQELPVGLKNYITPAGYQRLRNELDQLWKVERPVLVNTITWAASNGDRSENGDYIYGKKRLREIDRRIRFLSKRLDNAVVVDPAQRLNCEQVFFGATVTICGEDNNERTSRKSFSTGTIFNAKSSTSSHKIFTAYKPRFLRSFKSL